MEVLFRTAFYSAKNRRPFRDFKGFVQLQKCNGVITLETHICRNSLPVPRAIADGPGTVTDVGMLLLKHISNIWLSSIQEHVVVFSSVGDSLKCKSFRQPPNPCPDAVKKPGENVNTVASSKFFSILCDSSTDSSNVQGEIVYIQYLLHDERPTTKLVALKPVEKADAESITRVVVEAIERDLGAG
ncbi:uncharacterized protein [Branchiostoma lanceolatum]|uniref:uncharacterized protein n=1 Tax=Branchiostoma lanceolatum TaxID=7740 RepID=UPI00345551F5